MNKGLKRTMAVLLTVCAVGAFGACGKTGGNSSFETGSETSNVTSANGISIEATEEQIALLKDEAAMPITIKEDGETVSEGVTLTSDNECVVVENGQLKGVSHGKAEITVSYKTATEKFDVTVYDSFIDSEEDWWALYADLGGWYKMTADVTLSESTIDHFASESPTGAGHEVNKYFTGYLNGGDHLLTYQFARIFSKLQEGATIENIRLKASEGFYWGAAIAFECNASTVRNVKLEADFLYKDCWIVADGIGWIQSQCNGGLFYYVCENSLIENCDVKMDLSALGNVGLSQFGAVAGLVEKSTIRNCTAEVTKLEGAITRIPAVKDNTDSTVENVEVTQNTAKGAKYVVEYYLQTDTGYEKSEDLSEELIGAIGKKMIPERKAVVGYDFDAANENNVTSGVVKEDGSLVLKFYFNKQAAPQE